MFISAAPTNEGGQQGKASNSATPGRLAAVVLGVDLAGDGQGATVITVLLDASDSARLAAAPAGGVVLMQTAPAGD